MTVPAKAPCPHGILYPGPCDECDEATVRPIQRPKPDALLVPGLLAAAWWAAAGENTTGRGPDDMPGGWRELYDELERTAYAAIRAKAAEKPDV